MSRFSHIPYDIFMEQIINKILSDKPKAVLVVDCISSSIETQKHFN